MDNTFDLLVRRVAECAGIKPPERSGDAAKSSKNRTDAALSALTDGTSGSELEKIPDERLWEIYKTICSFREAKKQLYGMAKELESVYGARATSELVRAAAVHDIV